MLSKFVVIGLVSQYCCIPSTGTGGSFTDPALPPNKVTPFVLRITLTAFDGVTTVVVSRNINIGKCTVDYKQMHTYRQQTSPKPHRLCLCFSLNLLPSLQRQISSSS